MVDFECNKRVTRMISEELKEKPREWKIISDREHGSLFLLKRIVRADTAPKMTIRRFLGEKRASFIWLLSEFGIYWFSNRMQGGRE